MPNCDGFLLESGHKFFINTTPQELTDTYVRLGKGISSFDPQFNDEIDQTAYLDGDGRGTTTVTGNQLVIAFEGHRYYTDDAQDYIMALAFEIGCDRETDFRWIEPNGEVHYGAVTIANITGPSGDANAKGEIAFEVHFNGEPSFLPSPTAPTGLISSNITATGFDLDWNAVVVLGATITYDVYINDVVVGADLVSNSYTATGLQGATMYSVYVVAKTNFGSQSKQSATIQVTTL